MDKKKTDLILIVITVILVGVLIGGFIYDRNSALLARTNYFAISEDPNLELVKMEKAGFLYMRAGYQAKLQIKNGAADDYIIKIAETYGGQGQMFDYTQYKGYEADVLNNVSIRPDPRTDSFVWVLGVPLSATSTENIVYVVTVEGEGEAYIYLYYSRR
ncbi:MAG: hypothetical protein E7383_03625 [Ruminococcaceae bacterium]|nr:hypothetical protein [Oscillospiraceae bacterium]